jgi:predicted thioesterase
VFAADILTIPMQVSVNHAVAVSIGLVVAVGMVASIAVKPAKQKLIRTTMKINPGNFKT